MPSHKKPPRQGSNQKSRTRTEVGSNLNAGFSTKAGSKGESTVDDTGTLGHRSLMNYSSHSAAVLGYIPIDDKVRQSIEN